MNEKTTIGGVSYETIGSSTSNLLLKCNGTARIQWGNKLIDLIKNGKIASSDSSITTAVISEESEIKNDGLYILNKDDHSYFYIRTKGKIYNLTGTDLYISATEKQNITDEQKQQALHNIGLYYDTLADAQNSDIKNGIVYILENNMLYTITDGVFNEFQAQLKSVTVEETNTTGENINGSVKLTLSISNENYIILENEQITINAPIIVKDYVSISSEKADESQGYRLYMNGGFSYLDVDTVQVRQNIISNQVFQRGMIIMFSGISEIPEGWALCDGKTYTYNGVETVTPDLIGRFIKAVGTIDKIGPTDNPDLITNDDGTYAIQLNSDHLPEHNHPHTQHTHNIEQLNITVNDSGDLALVNNNVISTETTTVVSTITSEFIEHETKEVDNIKSTTDNIVGGNHTHSLTISDPIITPSTSTEDTKTWANKSIHIEPYYYALVFIIKL